MTFIMVSVWVFLGIITWIISYRYIQILNTRDFVMLAVYSLVGVFSFLGLIVYLIVTKNEKKMFFNPFYNND